MRCIIATEKKKSVSKKSTDKSPAGLKLAVEAARVASETHCKHVTVLDVRGVSPVTDYFVIATGTSARQMRSVCDDIDEMSREHGYKALGHSGLEGESWMLMDFVDMMFHVFNQEARQYYDLEGLWGDAKVVDWEKAIPKPRAKKSVKKKVD